ncbi:karyogamy protein [Hortaea werneckii]|nr:karyogamy protein [Hortaea werneckii]KAI6991810.1 karyogamy protein [Hortaea werneckii]KAI7172550.1 karyogamy protein [Hortaea werneckii]
MADLAPLILSDVNASNKQTVDSTVPPTSPVRSKRVSPGLEVRLQRLQEHKRRREAERREHGSIGKIPEEQLAELEELQRSRQGVEVARSGRTWSGPPVRVMPNNGGVRLDGRPVSEAETSTLESDVSSIISISERLVASDTEEEGAGTDYLQDKAKYRMPDIGKTRLSLRTKEPLSPSPRQTPVSPVGRPLSTSTPTTPGSARRGSGMAQSPGNAASPRSNRNSIFDNVSDSDWVGSGLSRAGSIYTLSRVSFTGQLSQLTSMRLPDANSLAKRISFIPTSKEAAKALSDATDQIRMWITQASEVLNGLNAEDDVEWAAAGGRDGIEEVDNAITRFDKLIQVYVTSIERLQTRKDVAELSPEELMGSVKQMETVITSWQKVKQTLKGVKEQVEVAMEWEELWNTVLGEIAQELEALNRLVFEMEEKRHDGAQSLLNGKDSIDLNELETIVEERPGRGPPPQNNRFSVPPFSPSSPMQPSASQQESRESSGLIALFARMQPLRASLDFLPMRLSVFHCRGNTVFPTGCLDLEQRRDQLEAQWKKLESDAESLRRELGEDRWVLVFRNAGRQALKMCESIARSYAKLREGIDADEHHASPHSYAKKVESYEAKKVHYGPAIERVLAIIDRGVLDRLTVNGEILRLQSDMKRRWAGLQADMRDMDSILEDFASEARHEKQLRDSVSTVMSSERSIASSLVDTPGSSPASSVVGASRKSSFVGCRTPTPLANGKTRQASYTTQAPASASRSTSRIPSSGSASSIPRRVPLNKSPFSDSRGSPSPLPSAARASRIELPATDRPKWINNMRTENRDFLPLSALEPSPYAKTPLTSKHNYLRSSTKTPSAPMGRISTATASRNVTAPSSLPRPQSAVPHATRKSSLPIPTCTLSSPNRAPSPLVPKSSSPAYRPGSRAQTPLPPRPGSSALRPASRLTTGRRSSMLATTSLVADGNEADSESPLRHKSRPPSAMASVGSGRRSSMLPLRSTSRMKMVDEIGGGRGGSLKPAWKP